jgi:hypothetical protein
LLQPLLPVVAELLQTVLLATEVDNVLEGNSTPIDKEKQPDHKEMRGKQPKMPKDLQRQPQKQPDYWDLLTPFPTNT